MGKQRKQWLILFFWAPKSLQMVIATVKLNDAYSLEGELWPTYFSSVQSLSRVRLYATPWTTAPQAFLSITNSWSSLKLMSIKSVMPSSHLILCRPLLLLPSIFPNFRGFSNESVLRIKWPKYCSFSFSISPSNEYSELISFRMDWLDLLQSKGLSRVFSNTTIQKQTSNLIRMVLVLWQDRLSALYLPCLSHWI